MNLTTVILLVLYLLPLALSILALRRARDARKRAAEARLAARQAKALAIGGPGRFGLSAGGVVTKAEVNERGGLDIYGFTPTEVSVVGLGPKLTEPGPNEPDTEGDVFTEEAMLGMVARFNRAAGQGADEQLERANRERRKVGLQPVELGEDGAAWVVRDEDEPDEAAP